MLPYADADGRDLTDEVTVGVGDVQLTGVVELAETTSGVEVGPHAQGQGKLGFEADEVAGQLAELDGAAVGTGLGK